MTTLNGPGTRALLVGTGGSAVEFGLSAVPALERTLADLSSSLTRYCGLDADRIRVVIDPPTPSELGLIIAEEAERATEVLLLYYVGHGLVSSGGELYLATRATDRRHTRLAHTSLAYAAVRDSLLESPAKSVVVVLDCCFSGRAIGVLSAGDSDVADLTQVYGGCVLTSAARDEMALAPPGQPYTAFSGEIIRLLTDGDPQGPPELTLRDTYQYLSRVLPAQGYPRPHQRVSEWIEDLVLAPNPAFRNNAGIAESSDAPTSLGPNSSERTSVLLESAARRSHRLPYMPEPQAVHAFRDFLGTTTRVFAVKGSSGCGKTRLMAYLASEFAHEADFQLHALDSWDLTTVDVAVEVLRFASLSQGEDPLLALERAAMRLARPCVVLVDGICTQAQMDRLGRQIDSVLRQTATSQLKFALAIRIPPDIGFSSYPVLDASLYEPSVHTRGASHFIGPWDERTAREVWALARGESDPTFTELPDSIRRLARLPLYMELLKAAGDTESVREINAFRLLDHCVRAIVRDGGHDADEALDLLQDLAQRELGYLIPNQLLDGTRAAAADMTATDLDRGAALAPLTERLQPGRLAFGHDVIREYALAVRIARLITAKGRSRVSVSALNELAIQSSTSAMARGLFEFVVYAIDSSSPELASALALAPSVAVTTTLPIMLRLARAGTQFANDEVLLASAKRCTSDNAVEVARSLLAIPSIAAALGEAYPSWLLTVLERFGSRIWSDIVAHIETTLHIQALEQLLAAVDLDKPAHATFLARYFYLVADGSHHQVALLEQLLGHSDWRVRAGLAASLTEADTNADSLAVHITERLVSDEDYKARAAIAKAAGRLAGTYLWPQYGTILSDPNWHVRTSLLEGLLDSDTQAAVGTALDVIVADPSWRRSPLRTRDLLVRLTLLHGDPELATEAATLSDRALRRILREHRTGWVQLGEATYRRLADLAHDSTNWLTRREADALSRNPPTSALFNPRESYRRLRGGKAIQVALDVHDLGHAATVAIAADRAGVDFIEVGDPLIKANGVSVIEHLRRDVTNAKIIAEMMSADWGRDQVELAVEAGADVVFLIGPASSASVAAAAEAGRRLGAPILLDVPATNLTESWVQEMERAGVDGFCVTTNIDQGVAGQQPLGKARAVRSWTRLPVAVSGGFSTMDRPIISSNDWDIIIVGRSIAEAVDPNYAARQMVTMVKGQKGSR